MTLFDVGRVTLVDIVYDEDVSFRPRNRKEYRDGQLHFQRLHLSSSGSTGKTRLTITRFFGLGCSYSSESLRYCLIHRWCRKDWTMSVSESRVRREL